MNLTADAAPSGFSFDVSKVRCGGENKLLVPARIVAQSDGVSQPWMRVDCQAASISRKAEQVVGVIEKSVIS